MQRERRPKVKRKVGGIDRRKKKKTPLLCWEKEGLPQESNEKARRSNF